MLISPWYLPKYPNIPYADPVTRFSRQLDLPNHKQTSFGPHTGLSFKTPSHSLLGELVDPQGADIFGGAFEALLGDMGKDLVSPIRGWVSWLGPSLVVGNEHDIESAQEATLSFLDLMLRALESQFNSF